MFQMKPGQTCSQKKWLKHIRLVAVGLLSFYFGGSKLVRSLAKTEHTKRKLLNFMMPSHQEVGINCLKMVVIKNVNSNKSCSPKLIFLIWVEYFQSRHVPKSKNLGGHTVMRRAAACRQRLLICQNLGGHPPFGTCLYCNEIFYI